MILDRERAHLYIGQRVGFRQYNTDTFRYAKIIGLHSPEDHSRGYIGVRWDDGREGTLHLSDVRVYVVCENCGLHEDDHIGTKCPFSPTHYRVPYFHGKKES